MGSMQDILDSAIKEACSIDNIVASIIQRRLKLLGIDLDLSQLDKIKTNLIEVGIENFKLELDDKFIPQGINKNDLEIKLTEEDADIFEKDFTKRMEQAVPQIIDDLSSRIFSRIKRDASGILKSDLKERRAFEKIIFKQWEKALNLLQVFINIAIEVGNDFNNEFRDIAIKENDHIFNVLTRLQARACQVASEVLVLLKPGYADGAHARWRCLHEIAVISFFISSNSSEVAERYILHEVIESYKAAKCYQNYCKQIGYEPLTDEEFNDLILEKDGLIKRFGEAYKNEYGWAGIVLNKKRPNFRDIEEYVRLEHFRPFYKMASHNIHANPKGVFFKLGLYPTDPEILLAGPSNLGLCDPGQGTALSLLQVTICLLTYKTTVDGLIFSHVLNRLEEEISSTFFEIHTSIESEILAE
ncbi:MAG: DUF5677 domain-containing protein [Desulfobaccales bacterium]